jgi:hypothetical protein
MKNFHLLLLLILTTTGCMDGLKVAPKVQELGVTKDIVLLEEGRKIYIHNCTKCHNALRISRYTQQEWDGILPDMIRKSKLSSAQAMQVDAYIKAVLLSSSTVAR